MVGIIKFLLIVYIVFSVFAVLGHIGKDDARNTTALSLAAVGIVVSGLIALTSLAYHF